MVVCRFFMLHQTLSLGGPGVGWRRETGPDGKEANQGWMKEGSGIGVKEANQGWMEEGTVPEVQGDRSLRADVYLRVSWLRRGKVAVSLVKTYRQVTLSGKNFRKEAWEA
jgi:hypothetical protein